MAVDTSTVAVERAQRRAVLVLSAAQVCGGLGVGAGVAVGGLIAAGVGNSESYAGLAQTTGVLGAALAAIPLARVTQSRGRRTGLSLGLGLGTTGAVIVLVAASARLLPLLLVGFLFFGSATAAGLQARYTATDLAEPDHRARALSTVVWATTVGAVAGPNLADPAGHLAISLGLPELSGAYLFSLVAFAGGGLVVWGLLRPDPLLLARARAASLGVDAHSSRSLRESLAVVRRSPRAMLGLGAIAVAHTAMVAVMVMTPVHMRHVEVTLTIIGLVISVHIAGMYAFSPLVGWLSDRYGRIPVIQAGVLLLVLAALVAGTSPADNAWRLGTGLFLLGLGWSCGLVAGSTLLTESVPLAERPGVQGASDLVMNGCGALGGVVAGIVVAVASYGLLTAIAGTLAIGLGLAAAHPACRVGSNTRST